MKVKDSSESKKAKALREREQLRAEADLTDNTMGLLDDETRRRMRRFGARSGGMSAITGALSGGTTGNARSGGGFAGGGFSTSGSMPAAY